MNKIFLLVYLGMIFEISFLFISYLAYLTDYLSTDNGSMVIIYASSLSLLCCCLTIFRLFSDVKSVTMDNLRWISKVGSIKNMIN